MFMILSLCLQRIILKRNALNQPQVRPVYYLFSKTFLLSRRWIHEFCFCLTSGLRIRKCRILQGEINETFTFWGSLRKCKKQRRFLAINVYIRFVFDFCSDFDLTLSAGFLLTTLFQFFKWLFLFEFSRLKVKWIPSLFTVSDPAGFKQ